MVAFNTIGRPKIAGSLTLKIPGASAKRPTSRYCFFFKTKAINNTTANVIPEPPIPTVKVSINGFVMICGSSFPC